MSKSVIMTGVNNNDFYQTDIVDKMRMYGL